MSDETPASATKRSAVEVAKTASNFLRGDIAQELADGTPGFGKPSVQLLENHGTYQQVLPPLTAIVWPVTNAASSLAR
jgi:hypothetical protein